MYKLLKDVECYAPEYMGRQNILVAFDRIWMISCNCDIKGIGPCQVEIIDCKGKIAVPGFMDQHVHITGGGGEHGPQSMIGPIHANMLASAGITTVVGILGADGVGKSMSGLLMKAHALEADGLTAYVYSGYYGIPTVTVTGSVMTDIALIEKIIGTGEIAISDYRSSHPTRSELAKLAYEALTGGMLGNKAGIVHLHVGDGREGLRPLLDLLENTDFPTSMFVPTHLNRNKTLFEQAYQYHENGGIIDLTAGENNGAGRSVPECLQKLHESRHGLERVTVSSDGNGSGAGASKKEAGNVMTLFNDIRTSVIEYGMPLEQVLRTVTENVAKVLKLHPSKGRLAAGSDADILLIDRDSFLPDMVFSRGKLLVKGGKPVSAGP